MDEWKNFINRIVLNVIARILYELLKFLFEDND